MTIRRIRTSTALAAVLLVLVFSQPAYAYLDPGTGSFLTQWIVALILGSLVTLRSYWQRLKRFSSRSSAEGTGNAAKPDA